MKKFSVIPALIFVALVPGWAGALTLDFSNHFADTNAIYLWMNTAGGSRVVFEETDFDQGHQDWTLAVNEPTRQFMYGTAMPQNTSGILLNFSEPVTRPFAFQWAEVKWSGAEYEFLGGGTYQWAGGRWHNNNGFSHQNDIVPIPIPASVLLVGTGLLGLGLLGWRRRDRSSTDREATFQEGLESMVSKLA